jgi:hypothetical protein
VLRTDPWRRWGDARKLLAPVARSPGERDLREGEAPADTLATEPRVHSFERSRPTRDTHVGALDIDLASMTRSYLQGPQALAVTLPAQRRTDSLRLLTGLWAEGVRVKEHISEVAAGPASPHG